ncbi:MAG TPA: pre-peptidase C-terminal domain-containing protein [Anaerolineae bacterium]
MRRYALLLLCLFLGLSLLTVVLAQEGEQRPLVPVEPPPQLVPSQTVWQPLEAEPVDWNELPLAFLNVDPADQCANAPLLELPTGVSAVVNNLTTAAADPALGCMWGAPSNSRGYRTAWYKFKAPHNGRVVIDTFSSNYDTVLAVYSSANDCATLTQLACNDDSQGFASRVSLNVSKDTTYYVEVADWQSGIATGNAELKISLVLEPINSRWQQTGTMPLPRTRHAAVLVGVDMYVIGGQTTVAGNPQLSNRLERFETDTGNWVQLANMPDTGYANTTAAYAQGRIYVPSGYNGDNQTFDGRHWVYHIASNHWSEAKSIGASPGWPHGTPFAWSAAVTPPEQNGYYLMGGLSSQPPLTATVQVHGETFFYRLADNTWLNSAPDMSTPRYAHTAAWVAGRVCVIGGISANNLLLPNGECYRPGTGAWQPIAPLKFARYGAGSAVGPNGKWYVFGGTDAEGAVPETEVYDPLADTWTVLDVTYDLGGSMNIPARAWPRGGFVGNTLWVVGGHATISQFPVLSLIQKLTVFPYDLFIPFARQAGTSPSDDNFSQARPLALNVPQQRNFDNQADYFDVYYFDLGSPTAVTASLTKIPLGSNYDLALYGSNKVLWGKSTNPGNLNEAIGLILNPGRYYVMVKRVFPAAGDPDPANYQIIVHQN